MAKSGRIAWRIYIAGGVVGIASFLLTNTFFRNEQMWDDAFGGAVCAVLVISIMYQRELNSREIERQKFLAFRATMVTVQDIMGSFLNSIQLVRLESEARMSPESIELFDRLIAETGAQLKALGQLEHLETKPMAVGSGIKYDEPHQRPTRTNGGTGSARG